MTTSDNNETVQGAIGGIKVAGVVAMTYWSIVFTDKNIYFLKHGSNYGPMIYGLVSDIQMTSRSKNTTAKSIDDFLSNSKQYYAVPRPDVSNQIDLKKNIFGLRVSLVDDLGKKIILKLGGKKAANFERLNTPGI